jgi:Fur family ferric uptake transcriptional regulator
MAKKRNARAAVAAVPDAFDLAALAKQLRAAGLRRTGPRVAVLARLSTAESPMTHGALADELAHLGFDRATIYRNLMDLTEAKLVRRSDHGDHVWRFELVGASARHHKVHPHLICTECGAVSCLEDVEVKLSAVRGSARRLRAQDLEVQLRGLCDRCA